MAALQAQPQGPEDDILYCLCQQRYVGGDAMVCCDGCHEWYHLKCMGVTPAQARSAKKWTCPLCNPSVKAGRRVAARSSMQLLACGSKP